MMPNHEKDANMANIAEEFIQRKGLEEEYHTYIKQRENNANGVNVDFDIMLGDADEHHNDTIKFTKILSVVADVVTIGSVSISAVYPSLFSKSTCYVAVAYLSYVMMKYIKWAYITHSCYIRKAFNVCGKNLPTLCGEPYSIVSKLKWLREHLNYNLNDFNESLYQSEWAAIWIDHTKSHTKIAFIETIQQWRSAFKNDRQMYARLDSLLAALKPIQITTVQVNPNSKKDRIKSITKQQRNDIMSAIQDVLDLLYQYKSKYHIVDKRELRE